MSDRIVGHKLFLGGLMLLERIPVEDARGSLERLYCSKIFSQFGIDKPPSQINLTRTLHKGAVRGMHFQYPPYAESKIVSCLRGQVFDVAVDLRRDSPTFLRWHGEILSPEDRNSLLIPEGSAHGFQALSDACELLIFHTKAYLQAAEGGLRPTDPGVGIAWPLPIADLSERDANHPLISPDFSGLIYEMQTLPHRTSGFTFADLGSSPPPIPICQSSVCMLPREVVPPAGTGVHELLACPD